MRFSWYAALIFGHGLLSPASAIATGVSSPSQPDADKTASSIIAAHSARLHGEEYSDRREWGAGDLNGDGVGDSVVLYTIEEGNKYSTYLLALLPSSRGFKAVGPVLVGGRGRRFVHFDSITDGRIKLSVEAFAPDDPLCCPSVKSTTEFVLKSSHLVEEAAATGTGKKRDARTPSSTSRGGRRP